jgi:hypothetical protein
VAKKTKNDRASRRDEDNPEWTKEGFARARPAAEVPPEFIGEKAAQELMRRGRGRLQKADKNGGSEASAPSGAFPRNRLPSAGVRYISPLAPWHVLPQHLIDARLPAAPLLPKCLRHVRVQPQRLIDLPATPTPPINRLNVLTRPAPRLPASVRYSAAIWIICCDAVRAAIPVEA